MEKQRLEAFSDGVIAIIITIMVLELKPPHEASFAALAQLAPVFFSYVLSFAYIAIYWKNHHHLLQASPHATGRVLWPCPSAAPAVAHPLRQRLDGGGPFRRSDGRGPWRSAAGPAISYIILSRMLLKTHGPESTLARALGVDVKGKISVLFYLLAIGLTFIDPRLSLRFTCSWR